MGGRKKLFIMGTGRDIFIWKVYSYLTRFRWARRQMYYKISKINSHKCKRMRNIRKYEDYVDLLDIVNSGKYRICKYKPVSPQDIGTKFHYFSNSMVEWDGFHKVAYYTLVVEGNESKEAFDYIKQLKYIEDIDSWLKQAMLVCFTREELADEIYKVLAGIKDSGVVSYLTVDIVGVGTINIGRRDSSE